MICRNGMFMAVLIVLCCAGLSPAWQEEQEASKPTPPPTPAPTATPAPTPTPVSTPVEDEVLVVVNGEKIRKSEVDDLFNIIMEQQLRGRPLPPPDRMAEDREQYGPQLLEALIDDELLEQSAKSLKVEVTDEDLRKEFDKTLSNYLIQAGKSREELAEQVKAGQGITLDELAEKQIAMPKFKESVLQTKLIEKRYPDKMSPSTEDIKAQYEKDLERVYTRPVMVRASHILIKSEGLTTPEQREEATKKAEVILEKAHQKDADFAALAREHSEGPLAPRGGDLNFFPREGAMVEPFAKAAFDLKVGEVSGIVETRFGFHIIKVTDRKEAKVVSLEEATEPIRTQLRAEKANELRSVYVAELRKKAKIEYPEHEKSDAAKKESDATKEDAGATQEGAGATEQ